MKPKTYAELGERLGLTLNEPPPGAASLYYVPPNLFVRERRVTRAGIHDLLMLHAHTQTAGLSPGWYRKWRTVQIARDLAKTRGISLPPRVWDEDKAQLAAALARPDFFSWRPDLEDIALERKRALRWTRRRSTTAKS